jgi:hypothetical protein
MDFFSGAGIPARAAGKAGTFAHPAGLFFWHSVKFFG